MAGASCFRHQRSNDHSFTAHERGTQHQCVGYGRWGPAQDAGGVCAAAAIRSEQSAIKRAEKAASEAAARTQDCKEAGAAARVSGGAAISIWLVWQQILVVRSKCVDLFIRRTTSASRQAGHHHDVTTQKSRSMGRKRGRRVPKRPRTANLCCSATHSKPTLDGQHDLPAQFQ